MVITDASNAMMKRVERARPMGALEAVIDEPRVELLGSGSAHGAEALRGDPGGGC
jgi:hypothetical protein